MKVPILPVVISLVISLSIVTLSLWKETRTLKRENKAITTEYNNYKIQAQERVSELIDLYDEREEAQDYFLDQVFKYKNNTKRENIVLEKPGLVSIKINKSFDQFVDSLTQETK